jgi:hypothetical protein
MATVTNGPTATVDSSNVSSYASNAFTPAQGDLLVAFVNASDTVAAGAMTGSANVTAFTRVGSAVRGTGAHTLYCFVGNTLVPASPSSMTVTFTCTGDAATGASIAVARVAGVTRAGLAAIRQFAKQDNVASGVAPAPAFANNALADNVTLAAYAGPVTAPFYTATVNWTEQVDVSYATPTSALAYQSRNSGFTGTTITAGTSTMGACCGLSVEIEGYASALNPLVAQAPQRQAPIRAAVI